MNGNDLWDEEPDDEFEDSDFDDSNFDDGDFDDDSTETVPCSECGADVYEDAEQCPHCGTYIIAQTNVWAGRPGWWIVLGLLGVVAVILALAGYAAR
ncbi:MAG TPA: zinc-ribbon domain-containing protein [Thermoguttaceae bacterium]|nr:zinc-ribbon domain-containing protein [Thermoguttaceae bacterium]